MSNIEKLVDQHIREYESRQKHVDELISRAHQQVDSDDQHTEVGVELADIQKARDELAVGLEELKRRPLEDWEINDIEQSGPMGIWYALVQQLERLIEKLEG